jgi:hypothetical protein
MEEFLKQIEIIENIQTDTRAGSILMLTEVKKLKRAIQQKLASDGVLADVSKCDHPEWHNF